MKSAKDAISVAGSPEWSALTPAEVGEADKNCDARAPGWIWGTLSRAVVKMNGTFPGDPRGARGKSQAAGAPGRTWRAGDVDWARPDPLQAAWDDGERVVRREIRQDEKGRRQPVLLVRPAAGHSSRARLDRLATNMGEGMSSTVRGRRSPGVYQDNGRSGADLEDCSGVPLSRPIGECKHGMAAELSLFLRLAIGIAVAAGKVHERCLIHRDIKPTNILVNEATARCGSPASAWRRAFLASANAEPPEVIAGTLAYMAPEQTGRMNRSVDLRSDLYAIGVTLYEMLIGKLPFTASDPMEWVHCHIARRPVHRPSG